MARTFLTALFVTVAFAASAQRPDFEPIDNDQMAAKAAEQMQKVDKAVTLTPEQKPDVQAIYMQVERQMQALDYRMQGQPKEDVEADMKSQYKVIDEWIDNQLSKVLTPAQLLHWREVNK